MARADKNGMIDGYMAVQSVRRSSDRQHDRPRPATVSDEENAANTPATETETGTGKSQTFGHTALPTRHNIRCYACGYQFVVTGRLDRVLCPKCKEQLHTGDKTICGPYTGTIQTVGTVTIHNGAKVTDSHITASVIRIAGECSKSHLHPGVRVELETGAVVDSAKMDTVDVLVDAGQTVNLETNLLCRNLKLAGSLRANVTASERVEINQSASFQGRIQSPALIVEEGAALRAQLHIKPHTTTKAPTEA